MEHIEIEEKRLLNNLMYSLEIAHNKEYVKTDIENFFELLTNLEGGENYIIKLEDMINSVEMTSYCEGILAGAKLFKKLNE